MSFIFALIFILIFEKLIDAQMIDAGIKIMMPIINISLVKKFSFLAEGENIISKMITKNNAMLAPIKYIALIITSVMCRREAANRKMELVKTDTT